MVMSPAEGPRGGRSTGWAKVTLAVVRRSPPPEVAPAECAKAAAIPAAAITGAKASASLSWVLIGFSFGEGVAATLGLVAPVRYARGIDFVRPCGCIASRLLADACGGWRSGD